MLEKAQNAFSNACDHPEMSDIAGVFVAIGHILRKQGKSAEALVVLAKSLATGKELYGESHHFYSETAVIMASVLFDQGKLAEALALFEPAQVAITAALGENHANAEPVFYQMAFAYKAQGRYAESLAQLARHLAVELETKGEGHPAVAIVRKEIAAVRALQEEAVGRLVGQVGGY